MRAERTRDYGDRGGGLYMPEELTELLLSQIILKRLCFGQRKAVIFMWTLLGSNQRPYACEAYALNQLS